MIQRLCFSIIKMCTGAYFTRNVISKTHFLVPLPRTLHFVGRQYELRTLHSRMDSSGDGQVVLSLCGLGGIGKTQIAIQFAHQVIERDTGISVFWVNGASISAVQESYYRIAVQCGILSTDQINSFFMSRVKRWLESESAGRWLMIVDNVDNAYEFLNGEEAAGKAPLAHMPKCSHGSILYTTRDLGFAEQVSFSNNVIKVSPLSESESIALLKKIATSPTNSRSPDDQSSSDDLALLSKELGYLPLAIAQAAIYMDTFRLPVSEYLRYFEDQETARRVLNFEAPDFTRDKGWESLYSTWKISFDRIRERNTLAADVLALMSFFDPDTIPISLLAEEFTDKLLLSDAISTLRAMALISPNNEGRTYAIHRLIQLFMQNWLESQGDRQRFLSMSLRLLARLFPTDQNKGYNTSTMLLQHATKVLTLEGVSEEDSLVRAELLEKVSHYELKLGRLQNAEKFALEALQITSRLPGSTARDVASCQVQVAKVLLALGRYREAWELATESFRSFQAIDSCGPHTLSSMDNLAEVLRHQGEYREAEQMHQKTLELKIKLLDESHVDTLTSMANLASTYRNQGRWEEAEKLEVQVLETRKTKLGADHPDTLMSIANLASTYQSQGRWEEAKQLQVQVLEISKIKLGADHPDTLTSINNLASTYQNQGRWEEAEQLFVQVIETRKTKLGVDHPNTLTSINNLALTYQNQGRWEEAEQLFVQVIETRKTKLGVDHPNTLTSINNLALTYQNQGRWEEAEQLFVQVIETRKTKLGVDHPDTLTSITNLALTYQNQGRWEEAEQLFVQVIETRKTKLGVDHPDTLTSIINLALTYQNQGRWEEAEQLFVQVIETRKTKLGVDHPDTLTSIINLALTYQNQGRWEEAEQLFVQVIETRKTKLGVDHPDTLTSIINLALTYQNQGRWEEAEQLFVQVIETRKTKLGVDHPDTLTSIINLALTYQNQGRWEEAEQLFVQVIETRKTKLGVDHPDTLTSITNLASTYQNQGRLEEAEQLFMQVIETRKTKLSVDHPSTLTSMAKLAFA
ncbi:hypothetical protein N7462_003098 [Penicillium macrosclerotiorum]|uniref:uncharacterized protein n=1 Tax=Penicillium macrosclerotiorum TaxID=303699 RepID=UPI0025491798|nr:uncharacterized protein N7462_003098 [Penicillium macrosclerotiorum]KAJ5688706.1 hypothetical protein N7462_003098 [Penicillium macrosclerotiorum]